MTTTMIPDSTDFLKRRAQALGLYGLLAHWEALVQQEWIPTVIEYEESERKRRSLERRARNAKLGRFKLMADFDWRRPKEIDRSLIERLFTLEFIKEPANILLIGGNGSRKTMIAKNLAQHAVINGYSALFVSASELLNDLAAQGTGSALTRRLRHYCRPHILVIDEPGYLASSAEHADLLFEVVTRRYQSKLFSPPTRFLPNGPRSSPAPLASSRSSTGSFTNQRSSKSPPILFASRKQRRELNCETPNRQKNNNGAIMARIPQGHLRHLRNNISIAKLIEHTLALPAKHRDGFLRFLCPICGEFNSAVNPHTNLARCFRCARNFNTIELVMTVRHCNFLDVVRFLEQLCMSTTCPQAPETLRRIDSLLHRR